MDKADEWTLEARFGPEMSAEEHERYLNSLLKMVSDERARMRARGEDVDGPVICRPSLERLYAAVEKRDRRLEAARADARKT